MVVNMRIESGNSGKLGNGLNTGSRSAVLDFYTGYLL